MLVKPRLEFASPHAQFAVRELDALRRGPQFSPAVEGATRKVVQRFQNLRYGHQLVVHNGRSASVTDRMPPFRLERDWAVVRANVRPSSVRARYRADAREAADVRADADDARYAAWRCASVARQRPRLTCRARSALAWAWSRS